MNLEQKLSNLIQIRRYVQDAVNGAFPSVKNDRIRELRPKLAELDGAIFELVMMMDASSMSVRRLTASSSDDDLKVSERMVLDDRTGQENPSSTVTVGNDGTVTVNGESVVPDTTPPVQQDVTPKKAAKKKGVVSRADSEE